MAGLIVAPDVNDELDVPAAVPPQPLTGRYSNENLIELGMKLCWPAGPKQTTAFHRETYVRRGETRSSKLHIQKIVMFLLLNIYRL